MTDLEKIHAQNETLGIMIAGQGKRLDDLEKKIDEHHADLMMAIDALLHGKTANPLSPQSRRDTEEKREIVVGGPGWTCDCGRYNANEFSNCSKCRERRKGAEAKDQKLETKDHEQR